MRKVSVFLLCLFQLAVVYAQDQVLEQQILDLSKRKFEWMVNKNLDSLTTVLDDRLKYAHSNGWIQSRQEVLDDFASGKADYEKVDVNEASVRLYPAMAIVMGKGKFVGTVNKNPFTLELLYTEVYVKKGKKWLLASRHASKF